MSFFNRSSIAVASFVATLGAIGSAPATAGAFIHNGATFEVVASNASGHTADFLYTADFTNPGWIGSGGTNYADYIIAIDFKLSGYTIASVDSFSTDASGNWSHKDGPSGANGCGGVNGSFACADDDPFSELGENPGQQTAGMVQWMFTVTFNEVIDPDDFMEADNHIGAFFLRCSDKNNGDRQCQKGLGLSESVSFTPDPDPDPDPDPMPTPGTMALFGLGILGLGLTRRRRRTA